MEGRGNINGNMFLSGDAAEVEGESLVAEAITDLHLLLVEMRTE